MSDMELNKGVLTPVYIDVNDEETAKAFFDNEPLKYFDSYVEMLREDPSRAGEYMWVNDKLYSVKWEIERETSMHEFAEVSEHEDGTIEFFTYHYNGGAGVEKIIEDELTK